MYRCHLRSGGPKFSDFSSKKKVMLQPILLKEYGTKEIHSMHGFLWARVSWLGWRVWLCKLRFRTIISFVNAAFETQLFLRCKRSIQRKQDLVYMKTFKHVPNFFSSSIPKIVWILRCFLTQHWILALLNLACSEKQSATPPVFLKVRSKCDNRFWIPDSKTLLCRQRNHLCYERLLFGSRNTFWDIFIRKIYSVHIPFSQKTAWNLQG